MKKIIILILSVTSLLTAQESVITNTGKRVTLNEDFTWSYIDKTTEEGYDFRRTRWGMTLEEVSETESADNLFSVESDKIIYNAKISDLDCIIVYFFINNILTSARYYFKEEHSNENDFLNDYKNLKNLLTKKYGTPETDDDWCRDDLYKDDISQWGFAVSLGHYVQFATWKNDVTEIQISLSGENYEFNHQIDYISVEFKELQESTLANRIIEDL